MRDRSRRADPPPPGAGASSVCTNRDRGGDRMPVIEVEHLSKRYRDVVAVDDVSFTVERGEIFGILGPNGAGKTTTVEIIEGLRTADGGSVRVLGLDPHRDGAELR
jgi:ABC-2 type transport system ATP-binding protein